MRPPNIKNSDFGICTLQVVQTLSTVALCGARRPRLLPFAIGIVATALGGMVVVGGLVFMFVHNTMGSTSRISIAIIATGGAIGGIVTIWVMLHFIYRWQKRMFDFGELLLWNSSEKTIRRAFDNVAVDIKPNDKLVVESGFEMSNLSRSNNHEWTHKVVVISDGSSTVLLRGHVSKGSLRRFVGAVNNQRAPTQTTAE